MSTQKLRHRGRVYTDMVLLMAQQNDAVTEQALGHFRHTARVVQQPLLLTVRDFRLKN